ncbi:hypothetical protein [Aquimarina sp. AU58]|uniref:hypothetical protein n=1 Tax=Aquimarina sp. AU58 TaxID=1874112 RepID=UPI001358DD8E|nr:hypothetical protein [Aquimarina sp. AU58]
MNEILETKLLLLYTIALLFGNFFEEWIIGTAASTGTLLVAATATHFWKKYVLNRNKKK